MYTIYQDVYVKIIVDRKKRLTALIWIICIAAVLSLTACVSAGVLPEPFSQIDPDAVTGNLENGVPYIILENKKPANTIRMQLIVQAGSLDEPKNKRGLAHFIEHMNFQGTEHFKSMEIVDYLESVGMRFGPEVNAYTGFGSTVYHIDVPADDREAVITGLRILQDWARGPVVSNDRLEIEKGVVLEEYRLRATDAKSRFFMYMLNDCAAGSPYHDRFPIGKPEHISHFAKSDIDSFTAVNYTRDRETVIISGDFEKGDMEALLRSHFTAQLPEGSGRNGPSYPASPQTDGFKIRYYVDRELQSPSFTWAVTTPSVAKNSLESLKWDFCAHAVFSALKQRIETMTLDIETGVSDGSADYWWTYGHRWQMRICISPRNGKMLEAYASLCTQLRNIELYGITNSEFQEARKTWGNTTHSLMNKKEEITSGQKADAMTEVITMDKPYAYDFSYYLARSAAVGSLNNASVHSWVKEYLDPEKAYLYVQTLEKNDAPSASALKRIVKQINKTDIPRITAAQLKPIVSDYPTPGSVVKEELIPGTPYEKWTLSNGIEMYLFPNDLKQHELIMKAYSRGGLSLLEDDEYALGRYALSVLAYNGAGNLTYSEIKDYLNGRTANVSFGLDETFAYINGTADGKDREDMGMMFKLLYANLAQPRRDASAEAAIIQKHREWLLNNTDNPDIQYYNQILLAQSDSNPRRKPFAPGFFDNLNADTASAQAKKFFGNPADFTFVFCGDYFRGTLKDLAAQWLASIPCNPPSLATPADRGIRPPAGAVKQIVSAGNEDQSKFTISITSDYPYSKEAIRSVFTLQEILRIRLIDVLRQDKGGTYGVGVSCSVFNDPYEHSEVRIQFSSDPSKEDAMYDALIDELENLSSGGIDDRDFGKGVAIVKRIISHGEKTNAFWADRIFYSLKDLGTLEGLPEMEQYYGQITKEEVVSMAARILDPERTVTVILNAQ